MLTIRANGLSLDKKLDRKVTTKLAGTDMIFTKESDSVENPKSLVM